MLFSLMISIQESLIILYIIIEFGEEHNICNINKIKDNQKLHKNNNGVENFQA